MLMMDPRKLAEVPEALPVLTSRDVRVGTTRLTGTVLSTGIGGPAMARVDSAELERGEVESAEGGDAEDEEGEDADMAEEGRDETVEDEEDTDGEDVKADEYVTGTGSGR